MQSGVALDIRVVTDFEVNCFTKLYIITPRSVCILVGNRHASDTELAYLHANHTASSILSFVHSSPILKRKIILDLCLYL
jgi:hypothetical protein